MVSSTLQWLEDKKATEPEFTEIWDRLAKPLSKKLFHQFTQEVYSLLTDPAMRDGRLFELYKGLLQPLLNNLNLLSIASIAVEASYQLTDKQQRLSFLLSVVKDFNSCLVRDQQALIILLSATAICEVELGRIASGTAHIQNAFSMITSITTNIDNSVSAAYERARSIYCRAQGDFDGYYSHSMLYLSYADLKQLDESAKVTVAVDIASAALTGPTSFSFHKLLIHPLITNLEDSANYGWLYKLVSAFASADLAAYESLRPEFISRSSILSSKTNVLDDKIRIIVITSHVFSRASTDSTQGRSFKLEELANLVHLNLTQLELLLMKALNAGVIKGSIDQEENIIQITYVLPRELTNKQISEDLMPQYEALIKKSEAAISALEAKFQRADLAGEEPQLIIEQSIPMIED